MIYENEYLQLFYDDRKSKDILILFNELRFKPNRKDYWGKILAQKIGLSAIGIVSKDRNWFPEMGMKSISKIINDITKENRNKIIYGASMGGYGSIKYSRALNATHVISISPQISINPADVQHFDKRYIKYYNSNLNNMMISPEDTSGNIYIIYDPKDERDKIHVNMIQEMNIKLNRINARQTNHATISCLRGTESFISMLEACLSDDTEKMQKAVSFYSKKSPIPMIVLADRLITAGRYDLYRPILDNFQEKFANQKMPTEVIKLLMKIGDSLFRKQQYILSKAAHEVCLKFDKKNIFAYTQLAQISYLCGDREKYQFYCDIIGKFPDSKPIARFEHWKAKIITAEL